MGLLPRGKRNNPFFAPSTLTGLSPVFQRIVACSNIALETPGLNKI